MTLRLAEGQVRHVVADRSDCPARAARRSGPREVAAGHAGDVEDEEDRDRCSRASRGAGVGPGTFRLRRFGSWEEVDDGSRGRRRRLAAPWWGTPPAANE